MRMRLFVSLTAILLFSLAACHPKSAGDARTGERAQGPAVAATPADGVRRVTVAELSAALEKGEAVAVDVRGGVDYDLGHIKGALSVPLGLVAERAKELPRDKLIVTYCA